MALNVLISECWWLVWGVIHLLNGHILFITVCPEVCTGTSSGHGVWRESIGRKDMDVGT